MSTESKPARRPLGGTLSWTLCVIAVLLIGFGSLHVALSARGSSMLLERLSTDLESGERFNAYTHQHLSTDDLWETLELLDATRARAENGDLELARMEPLLERVEAAYGDQVLSAREVRGFLKELRQLAR